MTVFIIMFAINMHAWFLPEDCILHELHRKTEMGREGKLTHLMSSSLIEEMLRLVFHNSCFLQHG